MYSLEQNYVVYKYKVWIIRVYEYVCVCVRACVRAYVRMCVCMRASERVCGWAGVRTCVRACMSVNVCLLVCACLSVVRVCKI